MPIQVDELMPLKNLGQNSYTDREVMALRFMASAWRRPDGRNRARFRQTKPPPRRAPLKWCRLFASVAAWGGGARRDESQTA